ncbi:MAG: hypothetical protein QM738_12120 [Ferruginibacter sp.]
MNPSLQALNDFVNDFNLRRPNGIIAFTAKIQFNTGQTAESEVQVITSDNVGAIYFLNIPDYELPDMFSVKKNVFEYVPQQCLKIESGDHRITVMPVL